MSRLIDNVNTEISKYLDEHGDMPKYLIIGSDSTILYYEMGMLEGLEDIDSLTYMPTKYGRLLIAVVNDLSFSGFKLA